MSKITSNTINRQKLDWLFNQPLNVQLEVMSQHMEIVRLVLNSIIEGEVSQLAGEHYSRLKPNNGRYNRWGTNPGSVKVGGQKLKIAVPRVYDQEQGRNRSLETYEQLKELPAQDWSLVNQVLHGISTRDYSKVIDRLYDSFGDSASSVSRQFQSRSQAALEAFESRKLDNHNFVALFIDGKYMAGDQMVIVLGVTELGVKIPLGIVQTHTENAVSIGNLLRDLVERGIHGELQQLNRAAARSLQEGLEETLTLHRLRVFSILGRSFKTTNCIESLNSQLGKYIGRVKNWSSSDMRYRWVASGLIEIEKKMQRVFNYKKLPKLKAALKRELESRNK